MFKAVVFDLDGVLCSSDEFHYLAWKRLANDIGLSFSRELNNKLRGISRKQSLEIILQANGRHLSDKQKEQYMAIKNDMYIYYLKNNMDKRYLAKNAEDVLQELKQKNIKLAVGSSSKNAMLILNLLEIEHYFDVIVDGTMIEKSKPDPEVFLTAAKRLSVLPRDCIVVEDAVSGIDAAKKGGFLAVGIGDAAQYSYTDKSIISLTEILDEFFNVEKR